MSRKPPSYTWKKLRKKYPDYYGTVFKEVHKKPAGGYNHSINIGILLAPNTGEGIVSQDKDKFMKTGVATKKIAEQINFWTDGRPSGGIF